MVIDEISGESFSDFSESLYKAKKILGLKDRFQSFIACNKCHKLYRRQDVENFCNETRTIMKCQHIEFPNSSRRRLRPCNTPLFLPMDTSVDNTQHGLIFPFAGIRQQLAIMFRRPGFEGLLWHWTNKSTSNNILSDIYDGQVWKTFKETNDEDLPFFSDQKSPIHISD